MGDTEGSGETGSEVGLMGVCGAPLIVAGGGDGGRVAVASELELGSGSDVELSCSMNCKGGKVMVCVPGASLDVSAVYGNENTVQCYY